MTATLLVPVLNEIRGLKAIMPRVPMVNQVLVVDGGSTDGSAEWCRNRGYEVYVQHARGLRLGLVEALSQVRQEEQERIAIILCAWCSRIVGQHYHPDPELIPEPAVQRGEKWIHRLVNWRGEWDLECQAAAIRKESGTDE